MCVCMCVWCARARVWNAHLEGAKGRVIEASIRHTTLLGLERAEGGGRGAPGGIHEPPLCTARGLRQKGAAPGYSSYCSHGGVEFMDRLVRRAPMRCALPGEPLSNENPPMAGQRGLGFERRVQLFRLSGRSVGAIPREKGEDGSSVHSDAHTLFYQRCIHEGVVVQGMNTIGNIFEPRLEAGRSLFWLVSRWWCYLGVL